MNPNMAQILVWDHIRNPARAAAARQAARHAAQGAARGPARPRLVRGA